MKELRSYRSAFKTETHSVDSGSMTLLKRRGGLSCCHSNGSIGFRDGALIAFYAYRNASLYDVEYLHLDPQGKALDVYQEEEGVNPLLFQSPGGDPWVTVTPYHPDQDLQIDLPVFGRKEFEPPERREEFPGDFAGTVGASALFHSEDPFSEAKPDRLFFLPFKERSVSKPRIVKVPPPRFNRVSTAEASISLLSCEKGLATHRILDPSGKTVMERRAPIGELRSFEIVSFDSAGLCACLFARGKAFVLASFRPDGTLFEKELLSLDYELSSTCPPVSLDPDTRLVLFTHEKGNGWLILRNGSLLECFLHAGGDAYTDLVGGKSIVFPFQDIIVCGAHRAGDHACGLSFYPRTELPRKPETLAFLTWMI